MDLLKVAFTALVVTMLTACGGDPRGENATDDPPGVNVDTGGNATVRLIDFDVDGTTGGSIIGINSGVDEGEFFVNWDVEGEGSYTATLYLSEDRELDTFADTFVFSRFCDDGFSCDGDVNNYPCYFGTDNVISCGTAPFFNSSTNISFFLDELPKNGYMILQLCDDTSDTECDEDLVRVQLQ